MPNSPKTTKQKSASAAKPSVLKLPKDSYLGKAKKRHAPSGLTDTKNAVQVPGDMGNQKKNLSTERGNEGEGALLSELPTNTASQIHQSSTPVSIPNAKEHGLSALQSKIDSSLLRIRTQIRQAKAAEEGSRMESAEESEGTVDMESYYSRDGANSESSFNSSTRTVSGTRMVLNEFPRHANRVLQQAKQELESSGNLKREIRESVVSAMQTLYEMVLKLSDSRTLHMQEAQRAKTALAIEEKKQAQRNSQTLNKALESTKVQYEAIKKELDKLNKNAEATRWILIQDMCEPVTEIKKKIEALQSDTTAHFVSTKEIQKIVKDQRAFPLAD